MKKGFKIGATTLALLMAFGATGCGNKEVTDEEGKAWAEANGYVLEQKLPEARKTGVVGETDCDKDPFNVVCSNIDETNLYQYVGHEGVVSIDIKTRDEYKNDGHLVNAVNVPIAEIWDATAEKGGTTLFYTDENGRFAPNYDNSVEVLKALFPQDKVLFINCAIGGRVKNMLKILNQYGWDMSKVYNVGGTNKYTGDNYKNLVVKGLDKYKEASGEFTELTGEATGNVHGASKTVEVTVYVDSETNKVGFVQITDGSYYSTEYEATVKAGLNDLLNSFVGKTAAEIEAAASNYATNGADAITGASETSTLIYNAVKNALA